MTEDESEVFEITDFTTASEWERFIARLEEIIHDWKLNVNSKSEPLTKGELTAGSWQERSDQLQFADFKFVITRHTLVKSSLSDGNPDNPHNVEIEKETDGTHQKTGELDIEDQDESGMVPPVWEDMMSAENDFPSRCHCLCRWYGLQDFVVLSPGNNMEDILSESRANLVMSSVAVGLHNTSCVVPVFLQVHQRWRRLFLGQCATPGFRTTFEMVHLKNIPHPYNHMAGLLDVFKAKIADPVSPAPPVSVAVRFTYVLQDWMNYSWPQQPPDIDSFSAREVGVTEFGDLPFGPCEDPINELHLSTTWPSLSEEMIVDNDVYSDLDPLQAPHWCVRVRMSESPQCLLGDYLMEFVQLCRRKESINQLLGKSIHDTEGETDVNASLALTRLTEPVAYNLPSLGTVVTRATSKLQMKPEEAPIPVDMLNEILMFVFPDAKIEKSKSHVGLVDHESNTDSEGATPTEGGSKEATPIPHSESSGDLAKYTEMFKQFKSAPSSSLSYRLAVCMCIVNHSYGGLRAVAHLWQEFVLEMRYRWENKVLVPDLDQGSPNTGCCLLHQKLQMLNCCIERKKTREAQVLKRSTSKRNRASSLTANAGDKDTNENNRESRTDGSQSSDDEFFECLESADDEDDNRNEEENKLPGKDPEPSTEPSEDRKREAEGRLKVLGDLMLLNGDSPLYVPLTQEPAPMTEDMLEEHAEVLAKLGTSAEGASLRARMQSACLLSDMESFKAANPGCILGDFVRWYSPRDWVEEEIIDEDGNITLKGQLSQRMQIPGNMWIEVWQSAKSVPAHRQRRLFDDTKEAEKVLHWLAALKPAEVSLRLMPMLIHAAFSKLLEQEDSRLPMIRKLLSQISSKAAKAMRASCMEVKKFEDLVRQMSMAEVVLTRAHSLRTKFSQEKADLDLSPNDLEQFVSDLLERPDVDILGASRAPLGTIIHRLFAASQKSAYLLPEEDDLEHEGDKAIKNIPDFPSPVGKEYILRTMSQCPAPWSRPSPQRMFCVLLKDDFRLAGAFTTDTTFQ